MFFDPFADIPPEALRDDDLFHVTPEGNLIPLTGAYAERLAELIEPVHICIPGSPDDPRHAQELPPWVVAHYVPELHPDDRDEVDGLPVTALARTLIDMGECVESEAELWQLFANARAMGLLDRDEMMASRGRVEWRPSLGMVDRVIADFFR